MRLFVATQPVLGCFQKLLVRTGLPDMRFHDLRHSITTLLLSMGVHPKVVQELLGHTTAYKRRWTPIVRYCQQFIRRLLTPCASFFEITLKTTQVDGFTNQNCAEFTLRKNSHTGL